MIACKHGNLLVDANNPEIEIFKLYANSPNNNGMSMYIQNSSLKNINNIQMGNLMFQFADKSPVQCKLQPTHDKIPFEKDILTFYYIIKETDHIRIAVMTETNNTVQEILRFNIDNTDVTFSNKEIVLNRLKAWNGNIYALSIYNITLSDDAITKTYSHLHSEYMKYMDQNYIDMIQQYNDALALMTKSLTCPYDNSVCDACSTVNKWNDMTQVMGSSTQCRKSINDFCTTNMTHSLCKCWNTQNASYKSDACKMFRAIFTDKNAFFNSLSQDDIDYIMTKYGLIKPENCPKPVQTPNVLKNTYSQYDYDKLKVSLDNSAKTVEDESDYSWNKLKINYEKDAVPDPDSANLRKKDMVVGNFYKNDSETNYTKQVKKEQDKLYATDDLNIIPDADDSMVMENTKEKQDGFFSRFMKIGYNK